MLGSAPGSGWNSCRLCPVGEPILRAVLADRPIAPGALLERFVAEAEGAGAVVSFCGVARPAGQDGAAVARLRLDHHPRLTLRSMEAITADGAARFDVARLLVVHRCGPIAPGETIVFVAAAARHRRAAFLAADYVMDRLKTDAVFWKKEEGVDGGRWIEPSAADRADRARWED